MESAPNFSSIIHSQPFTFLVGPQHTKLTIQSGLTEHVSKPLHNLMNGPTRESKHRIALLEEEEVETFVAFCEYAYTGDYSVPRLEREVQEEHQHGGVENSPSTATWGGNYRTGSMSSTIPPLAPSPPPQCRHGEQGPDHQPAPEPEPPVSQPVSEPVPAEAQEPVTPTLAPGPEAESVPGPETPVDVAKLEPETETYHEAEAGLETPAAEVRPADDNWAVPTEEPATVEPDEPKVNKKKGKKGKKGKKQELVEEDPSAPAEIVHLTPPSTPPPEVAIEPVPEPEAAPVEEWATANAVSEPDLEPTEHWEQPAEEPTPEAAPTKEQPPAPEGPMEDSWTQDRSEGAIITQAQRQRPMLDMSFATQQATSLCAPGLNLWDEFKSLQYDEPAHFKDPIETPSNDIPDITFHAKVYIFATRYLIPALAQLCLRKLHRDLLLLSLTDFEPADPGDSPVLDGLAATKAQMVLELVHYAYTKTARLEPISPTSATQLRENQLRRLVVHYAACTVKELSRYHSAKDSVAGTSLSVDAKAERPENFTSPKSFRALLDSTTELASDLVYRMM
ncbi:HSCB C-terminal oligomerization domain-containing protein [Penicillium digitatum]|nr:HSCB C-terminal oligomerization domain-containing protein [Penicillium digitatum]